MKFSKYIFVEFSMLGNLLLLKNLKEIQVQDVIFDFQETLH